MVFQSVFLALLDLIWTLESHPLLGRLAIDGIRVRTYFFPQIRVLSRDKYFSKGGLRGVFGGNFV